LLREARFNQGNYVFAVSWLSPTHQWTDAWFTRSTKCSLDVET
jgi:hypothetical protein